MEARDLRLTINNKKTQLQSRPITLSTYFEAPVSQFCSRHGLFRQAMIFTCTSVEMRIELLQLRMFSSLQIRAYGTWLVCESLAVQRNEGASNLIIDSDLTVT
jgi:hypothetical protein